MDPMVYVIVIAGAVVAGFVQGLSGFAFGLVAMSFWAWTLDPAMAAVLSVAGGLTGQIAAAITVRRGFDLKTLAPFLAGGVVGIPVGVALLPHLEVHVFKTLLGAVLVIFCPMMLLAARMPRIELNSRIADGVAGLAGGVLGGIGGFTGAVPTLWCTLRDMDKDAQRSIIQNFNLTTLAVILAIYVATGHVTRPMLPMLAIVAPAMLIPSLIGARLYVGLSQLAFRRLVLALLTASGVALLSAGLPGFFK